MTEIGKFLRKLRIDQGEVLFQMAQKLEVSSAFLSAVELGKRKMPYDWNIKIRALYPLTPMQEEEFDEAIAQSEKGVLLDFENASPKAKKLAVSFARSFDNLSNEQLETIKNMMRGENEK